MTEFEVKEKRFEADIEASLCSTGGYVKGDPKAFDRKVALDTATLLSFVQATQPKAWGKYSKVYGADSGKSLIDRFCKETRQVGLLRVLRNGLSDRGIQFRFVYWKPETALNDATVALYDKNILHCTRQLHYSLSSESSIDIALFLNGIPVVTMELKCQFTGQNVTNAIVQYKFDRAGKDAIFDFKNRVLVHFAVDLCNACMTTRLAGAATVFLPFNQGTGGAGNVGCAGNPANPEGYRTAYLWEQVLKKDNLLEIIHKYMHLQVKERENPKTGKKETQETMIFPRYHQLDAVTKLLADVKENGAGKNYLVQHSAGSGKSNSIAWLAHRLSGLHDGEENKIFQSIIVVSDRKVLDNQLQDTIFQFDHVKGVVQKIDKDSAQLRDAINSGAGIIITTLQKFPHIYREVNDSNKNFAVIVDEAHSSQSGKAAITLKKALADTEAVLAEYARLENEAEDKTPDGQDTLLNELAAQGQHRNLSFFAFTATPKDKTLQLFGQKGSDGNYKAFHIYSMRQAIEEGFILDVLKNYMTYNMFFKIVKGIPDDPEIDEAAGVRAIRRFQSLHPHNIAQKSAVMLEQFRNVTLHQIGGRAKAMVVTPSRLHAVRYLLEFRRQIKDRNYTDLDVLVAFSGEVDDAGLKYTEERLNKTRDGKSVKEGQLPASFHTDDFNVLIVAEKYQTGFDEPYLHTMFVDKKLSGVKAVQTLSRLNRTMRGKTDTFVLDFVNSAEDMQKAFEPYYEAAVLEQETDPNVVYSLKNTLDEFQIYTPSEIEHFCRIFYGSGKQSKDDMGKLSAALLPAVDRYKAKTLEEKDIFRKTLGRFSRIYTFITQVCRMFDRDLHKYSVCAKFLQKFLPAPDVEHVQVDDKILLEYYRLEKDFEGSITLKGSEGGFSPITGTAGGKEPQKDSLAEIIAKINERFGTEFTEVDKVLLEQIQNDFAADEKWKDYALNNDANTFKLLFERGFMDMAVKRYEQNDAFFVRMFNDGVFMDFMMNLMRVQIYKKLRESGKTSALTGGCMS